MCRKGSLNEQQTSGQEDSTLLETNSLIRQMATRRPALQGYFEVKLVSGLECSLVSVTTCVIE